MLIITKVWECGYGLGGKGQGQIDAKVTTFRDLKNNGECPFHIAQQVERLSKCPTYCKVLIQALMTCV